jgi:hypothetical protein
VEEGGAAASSPEVDGTGAFGAGSGAVGTAEAAEGEIMFSKVGANFFAFSKKIFISSRE